MCLFQDGKVISIYEYFNWIPFPVKVTNCHKQTKARNNPHLEEIRVSSPGCRNGLACRFFYPQIGPHSKWNLTLTKFLPISPRTSTDTPILPQRIQFLWSGIDSYWSPMLSSNPDNFIRTVLVYFVLKNIEWKRCFYCQVLEVPYWKSVRVSFVSGCVFRMMSFAIWN